MLKHKNIVELKEAFKRYLNILFYRKHKKNKNIFDEIIKIYLFQNLNLEKDEYIQFLNMLKETYQKFQKKNLMDQM